MSVKIQCTLLKKEAIRLGRDPYANKKFNKNPYAKKAGLRGNLVVLLDSALADRGLELIKPVSRCVKKYDVHELILTDEAALPGNIVNNIAYLGFIEFESGGVILKGDEVYVGDNLVGHIAGFDETHMPNHLNIVITTTNLKSGAELGLDVGMTVTIRMPEKNV